MRRISTMFRLSPGKAVSALAVLVLACVVAIGSGAALTSSTASPGNFVTSGALSMSNPDNGTAKFQISNVEPGFPAVSGRMLFRNTGTVPGTFSVNPAKDLADSLVVPRRNAADFLVASGSVFGQNGLDDDSALKRLSKGLHWRVSKLVPEPGTASCPTMIDANPDCYKLDPSGPLADGTLYDAYSAGVLSVGTVNPDAYSGLYFLIDWPTSDADSAARAGVQSDWDIQVTATT